MHAFVDTSALLALSHTRDQHHQHAASIAKPHQRGGDRYVSSTLVLSEFYSHLLYLRGPVVDVYLDHLDTDLTTIVRR